MPPDHDWPATPDVAPAVLARIDPGAPRRARRRIAALAAAALLVPAGGAVAYRWLDLGSVEVRRGQPPAGVPAPPRREPVPLPEAERRAGFAPILPPALGEPDAVRAAPGLIALDYGELRLAQLRGALDRLLVSKIVGANTAVRRVGGGVFIRGRHFYVYTRPDGSVREGRTATSTLLVERGDLLLRLSGDGLTAARAQRLLGG